MLEKIEEAHSDDGEVLFRLGELREADRQPERARSLVDQAIDAGYERPAAFLKRAGIREDHHNPDGASGDTRRVLESGQVAPPMVREAVRRAVRLGTCTPAEAVESVAVVSLGLDGKFWLANTFNRSREDLAIAEFLWKQVLESNDLPASRRDNAEHLLGMSYMGLGKCADAAQRFRKENQGIDDLSMVDAFNYGMAMWGVKGTVATEAFRRVVELDRSDTRTDKASNRLQCMAIAHWAVGDNCEAIDHVDRAQATVDTLGGRTEFSCWRYLQVDSRTFEADLAEIRHLIEEGGSRMPRFVAG